MANFITSVSGGTVRTDSYWVGFQAQVGASQDLMVSALGRWVVNPGQTHLVQLLDGRGTLLAQATVATAGVAANSFAWTTLASPIRLFAGTTFFVMSQEQNGDSWLDSNLTITVTAGDASAPAATYSVAGASPGLPTVVAGSAYVPPNFQYTTATPLPPLPSGPGKLITSITGGTHRHDFGGWVGFRFVVGSQPLPVLGLGRWILPNVTGTVTALHSIQLLDDSGNLVATATLDITGKPTGAFSYQRLNNQITLSAGTAYYLMVGETVNTDEWINSDAGLTTSADATITHNAYSTSGGLPTATAGVSAFVPPDLYYQFAAAAQNITAIGIASTTAFGTASVSAGAVNLAPAGIASTNLFGTASITQAGPAQNLAPNGIPSVTALGNALVSRGAVNIAPSGIASTTAFGNAAVSAGAVNIAPNGIASTNAFGTAALAASYSISPSGIASTNRFGTPSISFLVIYPVGIGSVTAFGTPAITTGPVGISPSGLPSTTVFGLPSIFIPPNPVGHYAGDPQETQIDVPAHIAYKYIDWEEGPWVMIPYAQLYPPAPEPELVLLGRDQVHQEWLMLHKPPKNRPRRMGDRADGPRSILPAPVRQQPIKRKPVPSAAPRRIR